MNVKERFLKYVSFDTRSDEHSETHPSTACQLQLGRYLADELISIGLTDVCLDQNGYVYGFLPPSEECKDLPAIGFIAHMDTSPDVSGANVKPSVIRYCGGDIPLGGKEVITTQRFPFIEKYKGEDIIVTDGTTLLGADDKAGIAEIFTACEHLASHPEIPHRGIAVAVTPDEETGRGADRFDYSRFAAEEAYTVDGGELGELEYENFNAASAKITINGVNIHPGSAKNKMKNAVLLAGEFMSMMPQSETPAHTEGYEGFYHISDIEGNESRATLNMIIRDHDSEKFTARKQFLVNLIGYLNSVWGDMTFECEIRDSYYNMKEKILPHMHLIENAKAAFRACGVDVREVPIRGGTDGARLSWEGLPCPNLSTGGMNFHSIHECIPVSAMEKMTQVIIELSKKA